MECLNVSMCAYLQGLELKLFHTYFKPPHSYAEPTEAHCDVFFGLFELVVFTGRKPMPIVRLAGLSSDWAKITGNFNFPMSPQITLIADTALTHCLSVVRCLAVYRPV